MENDREIRSNAKLKGLSRQTRDELWRMRNPEDDGEKVRYIDILLWLKNKGVDSSLGALSEFYAWERSERRMEAARARAEQARAMLAADPNATPEAIARVGQMAFTAEMVDAGNVKAFVQLEKLRLSQMQIQQDERRLAMLEAKAARLDAMESKAKELKQGGGLSAETLEMLEKQLKIL